MNTKWLRVSGNEYSESGFPVGKRGELVSVGNISSYKHCTLKTYHMLHKTYRKRKDSVIIGKKIDSIAKSPKGIEMARNYLSDSIDIDDIVTDLGFYSPEECMIGTPDLIIKSNGSMVPVEVKATRVRDPKDYHEFQCICYQILMESDYGFIWYPRNDDGNQFFVIELKEEKESVEEIHRIRDDILRMKRMYDDPIGKWPSEIPAKITSECNCIYQNSCIHPKAWESMLLRQEAH